MLVKIGFVHTLVFDQCFIPLAQCVPVLQACLFGSFAFVLILNLPVFETANAILRPNQFLTMLLYKPATYNTHLHAHLSYINLSPIPERALQWKRPILHTFQIL